MIENVYHAVVGISLLVLVAMFLLPILRIGLQKLRRQGLFFCVVVAGFLVSMATKPGPSEDPVIDPTPAVVTNTVTFNLGAHGVRTGGGELSQSVAYGESAIAPEFEVADGWQFVAWDVDFGSVTADLTVTAQWQEVQTPDPDSDPELKDLPSIISEVTGVPTLSKAVTYDGYLCTTDGKLAGTITVKAAKAKTVKSTGAVTSKLTISIQLADSTKKVSISGTYNVNDGLQTISAKGQEITLLLGENGMSGSYGDYVIVGVPSTNAANDNSYVGTYNLIAGEGTFSVAVAKKGKVKVTGTAAGKSVSVSAQLLVGEGVACVPVVAPKYGLVFMVWMNTDDATGAIASTVDGLTNAIIGQPSNLAGLSTFSLDAESLVASLSSDTTTVLSDYLPDGVEIGLNGTKWIVMPDGTGKAAKAGKLVWDKKANDGAGGINETKSKIDGCNVSSLKLTYTAKTGAFKGSFKVYTVVKGSLKNTTATVTGVVIDGIGHGMATIKKYGSFAVTIK